MGLKSILNDRSKEPYIIAETAFSHEGSIDYLKDMIMGLSNQNNIAIKFQILINKDSFLTPLNPIYQDIDKWLLSKNDWFEILDYAYNNNTNIILAVLDDEALEIAKQKKDKISGIEVHSSCIPDRDLLTKAVEFCYSEDIPLLLGVSGFDFSEITYLLQRYFANYNKEKLVFMYGFQNYPTRLDTINAERIKLLSEEFQIKVGYADHTEYKDENKWDIISMVYGMGVNIVEVHYVNEIGIERIDYITAFDASRIILLRNKLMLLNKVLGESKKEMNDSEKSYSINFRKIPVYANNFKKGYTLGKNDVVFKRSNLKGENRIFENDDFLGKKLIIDVYKNQPILKEELI